MGAVAALTRTCSRVSGLASLLLLALPIHAQLAPPAPVLIAQSGARATAAPRNDQYRVAKDCKGLAVLLNPVPRIPEFWQANGFPGSPGSFDISGARGDLPDRDAVERWLYAELIPITKSAFRYLERACPGAGIVDGKKNSVSVYLFSSGPLPAPESVAADLRKQDKVWGIQGLELIANGGDYIIQYTGYATRAKAFNQARGAGAPARSGTAQASQGGAGGDQRFVVSPGCQRVFGVLERVPKLPETDSFYFNHAERRLGPAGVSASPEVLAALREVIAPAFQQAVAFHKQKCGGAVPREVGLYEGQITRTIPDDGMLPKSYNDGYYVSLENLVLLVRPNPNALGDYYKNVAYHRAQEDAAKRESAAKQAREAALDAQLMAFRRKHGIGETTGDAPALLFTNPFALEGKAVDLAFQLERMQTATSGVFHSKRGPFVVSDIPRSVFVTATPKGVIAGTVVGNTKFEGSAVSVPHLRFKGVLLCRDPSCQSVDEK